MGQGAEAEPMGSGRTDRGTGDPVDERAYEDSWYRSLSAWGTVGSTPDGAPPAEGASEPTSIDAEREGTGEDPQPPGDEAVVDGTVAPE